MTPAAPLAQPQITTDGNDITARADVLVIGGGPAGCWSAIAAAESGASVVLVDKGYCGTTGAAAASGVGVWYVPPTPEAREAAMASRETLGGHLADRDWMGRVLDETYEQVGRLADWGYPFPVGDDGAEQRTSLQGPEYMRRMRRKVSRSRVKIWDHSPAVELLRDPDGAVAGATGVRRQKDGKWTVNAGATIIATGGCAFLGGGLGCNVLTGDGHLLAAEAGAQLSGMEFSNSYAICTAFGTVTKTAFYHWATFLREDGSEVEGASAKARSPIARALLNEKVYAVLDRAEPDLWPQLRRAQPNFFLPFDREGINPFTDRFEVTLRPEGTVRGTGGLRVVDEYCATSAPGLFAAGDASTRELICGGFTGGGSHNAAWAISSGTWAGRGAARHARGAGNAPTVTGLGRVGLAPQDRPTGDLEPHELVRAVQAEVHPYDKNYFRTAEGLAGSSARLERLWEQARDTLGSTPADVVRTREATAMLAHARWMYASAARRTETRGMHKRLDHAGLDPAQHHRLLVGGLDDLWTDVDPTGPQAAVALAA
jgi:succinate dehydrogenase/fumarate reductase flavoprotein subunit